MRPILSISIFLVSGAAFAQQALPDLGSSASDADRRAKSYAIPAAEIVGFQFLLNRIDHVIYGRDYRVTSSTIRRNLHRKWVVDNDPFKVNQLGHPYQGSIYHGLARSAGLGFWESMGYSFAGSMIWGIAGEDTLPSKNDQIASGIAGSFLGESFFCMVSVVLEKGEGHRFWREVAAAASSPATGFNRVAFHDRFSEVLNSKNPSYYGRVQVGASGTVIHQAGNSTDVKSNELLVDYSMDYGLPGKPGHHYDRPWDYFSFQIIASSANAVESMSTRGLLIGKEYEAGERYRGIWGLYGGYDYVSPQVFRVSSTALSLGTTGEVRLADEIAVQGSLLAGVGYAGVGTVHGSLNTDYHYGVAPQALLALRVIYGDRASLDLTARDFFVSHVAGSGNGGHDNNPRTHPPFTPRGRPAQGPAINDPRSRRVATFSRLSR